MLQDSLRFTQRPFTSPLLGGDPSERSRWAGALSQPFHSYVCALQAHPLEASRCSGPQPAMQAVQIVPLREPLASSHHLSLFGGLYGIS